MSSSYNNRYLVTTEIIKTTNDTKDGNGIGITFGKNADRNIIIKELSSTFDCQNPKHDIVIGQRVISINKIPIIDDMIPHDVDNIIRKLGVGTAITFITCRVGEKIILNFNTSVGTGGKEASSKIDRTIPRSLELAYGNNKTIENDHEGFVSFCNSCDKIMQDYIKNALSTISVGAMKHHIKSIGELSGRILLGAFVVFTPSISSNDHGIVSYKKQNKFNCIKKLTKVCDAMTNRRTTSKMYGYKFQIIQDIIKQEKEDEENAAAATTTTTKKTDKDDNDIEKFINSIHIQITFVGPQ